MKNNNKGMTFVYGSDDFLVDRRSRILFNSIGGGKGEIFNVDPTGNTVQCVGDIISALVTVSLFDDSDTLWIRGAHFFAALSEEEKSSVIALLDAMKANHEKSVIISTTGVDRRTKIFKDLTLLAESIDIDANPNAVNDAVAEFAKSSGVRIDPAARRLLRLKCGSDTRLLEREIEKLSMYILGRSDTISENDVSAIVDDYDCGNFFEPVEKFFSCDIGTVFQSMDRYFFHNSDARQLLSALQSRNRLMIQLRASIEMNRIKIFNNSLSKSDFARAAEFFHMSNQRKTTFNLFSQNIWFVSKLASACMKFDLSELLRFQSAFSSAFTAITERAHEQKSVLKELAVACLCRR